MVSSVTCKNCMQSPSSLLSVSVCFQVIDFTVNCCRLVTTKKIVFNNVDRILHKDNQASFKKMTCLLKETAKNSVILSGGSRAEGV